MSENDGFLVFDSMLLPLESSTTVSNRSTISTLLGSIRSRQTSIEAPTSSFHRGSKLNISLIPFHLKWSYGVNFHTPVINLSVKSKPVIFYSTSHAGVLYDYVAKDMHHLQGHRNAISSIAADDSGDWLVTADAGEDNVVIIWECLKCKPVSTLFNPHPHCGTAVVGLSGNAKYLVTVSNERKPLVGFWLWTFGNEEPNDSYRLETNYGTPKKVSFNPNVQEYFMVAFERQVIFLYWSEKDGKLVCSEIPEIRTKKTMGMITDSTYIDRCHECIASTTEGCMLVFGSTLFTLPLDEAGLSNEKIFVKMIGLSKSAINCVESVDGIIATGDVSGNVKFFDSKLRILYWCQNFKLEAILSISFKLEPRVYKFQDPLDLGTDISLFSPTRILQGDYEDRVEEYEVLYKQLVPSDATLHRLPFVVRDFIVFTADGRIATVDYINNKCDFLFPKAENKVVAIETHSERPYLLAAYKNGRICMYNYHTHKMLVEYLLPPITNEETGKLAKISFIKYATSSIHLACGYSNGNFRFLEPITLEPKSELFHPTKYSVIKIDFAADNKFCAYFDDYQTICLFKYKSKGDYWEFLGKMRSHYKAIHDIIFTPYTPSRLFTISEDRHIVEYDCRNSANGIVQMVARDRIDQVAIPQSFIYHPETADVTDSYFIIADNQFKYKMVNDGTLMCRKVTLGPAYGCYSNSMVQKMLIIPRHEGKFMIFATDKHIGIQMLPMEGNPYHFTGIIGHPKKLRNFCTCFEGKYIFTIGKDDTCILSWSINTLSVKAMAKLGGTELQPYYCLIEGGIHGYLFKEMQDLFYYMQILNQGENTMYPRKVSDYIPIIELPDLMRACGFYPSEYEVENMIIDVKYREYDNTKEMLDNISFLEFVKLYINHRPAQGVSAERLQLSFETFCQAVDDPQIGSIDRNEFVNALCSKGELFTRNNVHKCLATLMHYDEEEDDEERDFDFLPESISYEIFMEDVLGIDMERAVEDSTEE